ncbi:MAG: proline iminopeptidase-family hydrolase [Candidatus Magasanikbacteria bacterium]|nr:proline iminopeptidase-family hydrolase [Candidatus Magasanikbacteria bacterium]
MIEGFTKVIGGNIYYKIYGANKKGTPLLLIHGGPGYHGTLAAISPLSKKRKIIIYHQLGSGKSDRPNDKKLWVVERFVDEVEKLRIALNLNKMHVLGHSWGAAIAAEYAIKNKSHVRSLILASPFLSAAIWVNDAKRLIKKIPLKMQQTIVTSTKTNDFKSKEYKAAVKEYYKRFLIRIKRPALSKLSLKLGNSDIYEYMWGPNEFSCTGTLKNYYVVEKLAYLDLPILITCGKYDQITSDTVNSLVKKLKNAKAVMFSKSSHVPHLEEKEKYLKVINAFMNKNES